MKTKTTIVILGAVVGLMTLLFLSTPAGAQGPPAPDSAEFPTYVLRKIDDQYRGDKSQGIMEMHIKTKHWTRALSMESWSLGEDHSLVKILSPKKERGTATLKADKTLFTYLNKTGRTIKINSSMMGSSWMGSHFNNDDLIQETRLSRDFKAKMVFTGQEKGIGVHRLELIPKPNVPVVWGKILVTIRASDLQPLTQVFYDEKGKKIRQMDYANYKTIDGVTMPMQMTVKPLDGSGEYTRVTWKKINFKVKLNKSFFSLHNLKSI